MNVFFLCGYNLWFSVFIHQKEDSVCDAPLPYTPGKQISVHLYN